MRKIARKFSMVFAAGVLGGLINSLAVWFFGAKGITAALGVKIAPHLSAYWLYPRLVWGGIWGGLFLIPVLRNSIFWRGFLFSLAPSAVQLLVVFPSKASNGFLGFHLGTLTPAFVVFFNLIWGLVAATWLRLAKE